jgi:hypothetical protein
MQRRDFIRDLAVGAAALAVAPSVGWLGRASVPPVGPEGWSGAAFAHCQGTTFRVAGPLGTQQLTLDKVSRRSSQGMETASLRFRGNARQQLAQGTYVFVHPDLGRMSILVVPGLTPDGDCSYGAVFNRFV